MKKLLLICACIANANAFNPVVVDTLSQTEQNKVEISILKGQAKINSDTAETNAQAIWATAQGLELANEKYETLENEVVSMRSKIASNTEKYNSLASKATSNADDILSFEEQITELDADQSAVAEQMEDLHGLMAKTKYFDKNISITNAVASLSYHHKPINAKDFSISGALGYGSYKQTHGGALGVEILYGVTENISFGANANIGFDPTEIQSVKNNLWQVGLGLSVTYGGSVQ